MWVFWLMFGISVVNYLDRLLTVAVGPTLKTQFALNDRDIGLLSSAFLAVYTLATLPLGVLADRANRSRIVALGVGLWSLMSGATAFVRSFGGLFVSRTLVGVGEASYYPAGTALLSAYFPLNRRARIMSRWATGQLVGTALAFAVSAAFFAWLGPSAGWRVAFVVAAIPGFIFAALMWFVHDLRQTPQSAEPVHAESSADQRRTTATRQALADAAARTRAVLAIPTVRLGIGLQALTFIVVTPTVTFLPIYLRSPQCPFRLTATEVSLLSGGILIVGGICGALLGGELAGWLSRRSPGGRILATGVGFGVALVFYVLMLTTRSLPVFVVAGTLTVLAIYVPNGPLNAATQDATPPHLRASSVAVVLLISHLLGDAWAPGAIGSLSTALGEQTGLALLLVGAPALLIAAVLGIFGRNIYARDVAARAKEQPSGVD